MLGPNHNGHSNPGGRFVNIGKEVYLAPRQNAKVMDSETNPSHPTVILIFGWMGAKLAHLHKYTQIYEMRYPDATQILIRCSSSFFWSSNKANEAGLAPVVETLEALGCVTPSGNPSSRQQADTEPTAPSSANHRILVHSFSNGGAMKLATLGRMLSNRPGRIHFPSALIIDSAPGSPSLQHALRAFSSAIRNRLVLYLVTLAIYIVSGYAYIMHILFGRQIALNKLRDDLINPKILPWVDANTPRLYVFSKEDEMVQWDRVKAHVEEARARGLNVRSEIFEKSRHVAHLKDDPERYWGAVCRVWDEAC